MSDKVVDELPVHVGPRSSPIPRLQRPYLVFASRLGNMASYLGLVYPRGEAQYQDYAEHRFRTEGRNCPHRPKRNQGRN